MFKLSQALSSKHLSHLDFSTRFKFIRHEKNPQLFSYLLMRDTETKRTVLAKNYIYESQNQLQTIFQDYEQLLKIYSHNYNFQNSATKVTINPSNTLNPYFCDFIGFCLEKQNNEDLIYLLYDYHHSTLQEEINSKKLPNNRQKMRKAFSQQQINCFLESCLRALCHLQNHGMNFLCWSFKYILIENLGHIDMKFRLLFTPFLTDAVEQIQKEKPDVEDYFLSELQLTNLSKSETSRAMTFSQKLQSDKQSLGLMALKMATVLNQQDRYYEMNENFELAWNSLSLKNRFEFLSNNYSSDLMKKIEFLIFEQQSFFSFKDYCNNTFMSDQNFITFSGNKDANGNKSRVSVKSKNSSRTKKNRVSLEKNKVESRVSSGQRGNSNLFSTIKKIHHENDFELEGENTPDRNKIISESPSKIKKNKYETKLQYLETTFMSKIPKETIHRLEDPKIGETYLGQIKNGVKKGLGINYNREGDVYFGEWLNDQMTGEGTYLFKNSDTYSGEIYKGMKHGHGRYQHWNGNVYEGEWLNDLKNGYGRYEYVHKGELYEGQFRNNLREGQGEYRWKNGSRFQGSFARGYKQGYGIAYLADGTIIDGKWNKDILDGKSIKIKYSSKKEFHGDILRGVIEGNGQEEDSLGFNCKGTYKNNKRIGIFQIHYSNGDQYNGELLENVPHGQGAYFYQHREITYSGGWKNGKQDGLGRLKFSNGTEIECEWREGNHEKMGKIRYSNGDQYCGQINGLGRNGRGVYVNSHGQTFKGIFKNGVLISSQ